MFFLYALLFYIFSGLSIYLYAVIKNKETIGYYNWTITKTHIGVFPYPRWTLFWLYWIVKKVRGY